MGKIKDIIRKAGKDTEVTEEKLVNVTAMVPASYRTHWQIQSKLAGYKSLKSAIIELLTEKFGEPKKQ